MSSSVEERIKQFIQSVLPDYEVVVAGEVKAVRVARPTAVVQLSRAEHRLAAIGAFVTEHSFDVDVILIDVVGFRQSFVEAVKKVEEDVSRLIAALMTAPNAVEGYVLTFTSRSDVSESSRYPGVVRCKVSFALTSYTTKS